MSSHYLHLNDPETLEIPALDLPALPELIDPDWQEPVPVPSSGDIESMVPVEHRRIKTLPIYWHDGWEAARPDMHLRAGAMNGLIEAAEKLPERFGLAVMDAWRPLRLQQELYEVAYSNPDLPPGFVNPPSLDPTTPPPHLTGGTVDLTLTFDGHPLGLGTAFDDFTDAAYTRSFEDRPGKVRDLRRLLYHTMSSAGWVVLDNEWWHFEFGTRYWAALTGRPVRYGAADIVLRDRRPHTTHFRNV